MRHDAIPQLPLRNVLRKVAKEYAKRPYINKRTDDRADYGQRAHGEGEGSMEEQALVLATVLILIVMVPAMMGPFIHFGNQVEEE